ncbi:hypothetical protein MKW98_018998 [Papaver atlanticum]|uniref:F-box domain-containing protein n=1 Tax=Papaver atlanticum TaxID=357466 RepID=A0AAD4TIS9_9MAGN|nr:hypothetical protein MKW98_018998 [Papaver atlanticum]
MSKVNRRRDCIVDVNDDDVRTPFGLLDGRTLCEILVRLPVKSLLQVKCVCKHWRSLVRDPYFVGLHCNRSKACPKLLIFVCRPLSLLFSVDLFEGGVLLDQMKLELPYEHNPHRILNLVNGLGCFVHSKGTVLIYNPCTGDKTSWIESRVLKENNRVNRPFYGFGFDSKTKEHKVVCVWHSDDTSGYETGAIDVCEVLTVGQNTWRMIDDVPPYKAYGESVYVNGVVYWLSTYNYAHSST